MKLEVKLPKTYYSYANLEVEKQDKDDKQRMAVSLSAYQACVLDRYCYNNNAMTFQEVFKSIIVDKGIVTAEEINLRNTIRKKFDFLRDGKFDCSKYENIKTYKQYLLYMSSYAKTKIIQYLIKHEMDLTWFLKKELVNKGILNIEDLSK